MSEKKKPGYRTTKVGFSAKTKTTHSPTYHPLEDDNWTFIYMGLHTVT